jgi:putative flavoprotein involved in K+ transport
VPETDPVAVIGAGPAGLAVAAVLRRRGVPVQVLERGDAVGTSWRARYDGLRLNTVRWLSQLPGLGIPSGAGLWVARDDYVAYLDRYAGYHRLDVVTGVEVTGVSRGGTPPARWTVDTTKGDLAASAVVVASGAFDRPTVPPWPGLDRFRGAFTHASAYREPTPYRGRHVLVVGAGASGLEIALLLAEGGAARVELSVRSCTNLFPRQVGPFPLTPLPATRYAPAPVLNLAGTAIHRLLGRNWPHPLPRSPAGLGTALRADRTEPVVADGVVDALRRGRIHLVPPVIGFTGAGVCLLGGAVVQPDAVLAATGYRSGLSDLVAGLGILDAARGPVHGDGRPCPGAPGLAFVGFQPAITGRLPQLPAQARRAARTITAALRG